MESIASARLQILAGLMRNIAGMMLCSLNTDSLQLLRFVSFPTQINIQSRSEVAMCCEHAAWIQPSVICHSHEHLSYSDACVEHLELVNGNRRYLE